MSSFELKILNYYFYFYLYFDFCVYFYFVNFFVGLFTHHWRSLSCSLPLCHWLQNSICERVGTILCSKYLWGENRVEKSILYTTIHLFLHLFHLHSPTWYNCFHSYPHFFAIFHCKQQGNKANQDFIQALQPQKVVTDDYLDTLGVKVQIDPSTGKITATSTAASSTTATTTTTATATATSTATATDIATTSDIL